MKARLAALAAGLFLAATAAHSQVLISQGFNDISTLAGSGWVLNNASTPVGTTGWFQGNSIDSFSAQAGPSNSYIAANFNNAAGGGTLANYLITPTFSTATAGLVTFFARADLFPGYADHLRFGFSTGGSSFSDFVFGATQTIGGAWTQYFATFAAAGAGSMGRFAVEYVGLADASNYVGIDTLTVASVVPVPEPETWALLVVGFAGLGALSRRRRSIR